MRSLNRPLLIQMIGDIIITQPLAHWQARLIEQDVPCSPVNTIDKVVVQPQVLARDMVHEMDLEGLGKIAMAGLPIKFSDSPGEIRLPPPRLGQHTAEVMAAAGFTDEQIQTLAAQGTIGLDPGWVKVPKVGQST
jgi:crotonobetainyl-CoA:carnitine CoA-transferase CaiB-like acyl-CoA transferase